MKFALELPTNLCHLLECLKHDLLSPPTVDVLEKRLGAKDTASLLMYLENHSAFIYIVSPQASQDGVWEIFVFTTHPTGENELLRSSTIGNKVVSHRRVAVPFAHVSADRQQCQHLLRDLVCLRDNKFPDAVPKVKKKGRKMEESREPPCMKYIIDFLLPTLCSESTRGKYAFSSAPLLQFATHI